MQSPSRPSSPEEPRDGSGLADSAYAAYSSELHRYLLRRIRRREDADDLAQEVFLRLMRVARPERLRKPVAYVFSVAAHLVLEFKLRVGREQRHVTYDSEALEVAAETTSTGAADELADRLDLEQRLLSGLKRLPRAHRHVLLLVKRDGLTHQEAAKVTGYSVNTIERYVTEATARMARMMLDRGISD
jgi:RNA polymerase sigma-19 factor, ECF subfamily